MNFVNNDIVIEELIYIPTGNYTPVFNRPYVVSVTNSAVDTITERMHSNKAGKVTPALLNGVASEIIQPSTVGFMSTINDNWVSTRRYIFLLKVKTVNSIGIVINNYLQGYTEYDGITNSGNIDGNLIHTINNIVETTEYDIHTPLGIIRKEKLTNIYNLLYNTMGNDVFTQRPNDIFSNLTAINASAFLRDSVVEVRHMDNVMSPMYGKTVGSFTDNHITTEYLSKILTSGILKNRENDIFINSYEIDSIGNTPVIIEASPNDNRFLKYLSMLNGYKVVRECFSFNSLMKIDQSIYNRFKVIRLNKDYVDPLVNNTPEVGDYWYGQDPVTVKAYSLIENSVSLATKYGFNKLYFIASNMTDATGTAQIFITNFNSFINLEEVDFNYLLEIFKEKFISEIFINETSGGVVPLHLECYVDLLGTSKINLSYSHFPSNWYTIPTFANSGFVPIMTIDKNALDVTTQNLGSLIESINMNTMVNVGKEYSY
jgi:hypothetical protein